jgi:hypothetical protein
MLVHKPENCPETDWVRKVLQFGRVSEIPDVVPVKLSSGFKTRFSMV